MVCDWVSHITANENFITVKSLGLPRRSWLVNIWSHQPVKHHVSSVWCTHMFAAQILPLLVKSLLCKIGNRSAPIKSNRSFVIPSCYWTSPIFMAYCSTRPLLYLQLKAVTFILSSRHFYTFNPFCDQWNPINVGSVPLILCYLDPIPYFRSMFFHVFPFWSFSTALQPWRPRRNGGHCPGRQSEIVTGQQERIHWRNS